MNEVVCDNREYVEKFIKENIPSLSVKRADATYLLWINCKKVSLPSKVFADFLRKETGLILTDGTVYGKGGDGYLRMNVACPRKTLLDALNRLKTGTEKFLALNH